MSHFRNYSYCGSCDPASRYKSGSASSVLAATTYGNGYNPLSTPASSKLSMAWPGSNSVSPSIWSKDHQGSTQWPLGYNYAGYNHPGYGQYYNQYQYVSQVPQMSQAPQVSHTPMHARRPSQHQQPVAQPVSQPVITMPVYPVQVVPVHSYAPAAPRVPILVAQPPSQPVVQPVMQPVAPPIAPSIPAHLQSFTRAPVPHYQHIGYGDVSQSETEYDLYTCAKFCVAVAAGLFGDPQTSDETAQIEHFVEVLLGATHLTKSTLMMSFVFLNKWNSLESEILQGTDCKTRILMSFVLANKMNDDNTFTNASWGTVTKMEPARITALELAWLDAMNWRMNLDKAGIEEWHYWQACWNQYEQTVHSCYLPSPTSPVWPHSFLMEPFPLAAAC